MKTIFPGPHPYSRRARRPATRYARSHALMTRIAVTLSLVFALGMVISRVSRPETVPPSQPGVQSPVR